MKLKNLKEIKALIGPYPYNPYLLFITFFGFFFARFIPIIIDLPAGRQRFTAAFLIILVSLIPGLLFAGAAILIEKFRFWSEKSLILYILEIVSVQFIFILYGVIIHPIITDRLKYSYSTAIQVSPGIFVGSLILMLFILALMHRSEKKISERLLIANDLVQRLKIDREQLVEADEKLREQTSRFLHDRVQSDLMVVGMKLRSIAGKSSLEVNDVIERSIERLEGTRASDLRNLVEVLAPNFDAGGLSGALDTLIEQYRTNMEVKYEIDGSSEKLNEDSLLGIFRIIEQSLLNSLIHGPSSRVAISIQTDMDGKTKLIISDDGPGADSADVISGMGTAIINSWVGILNGKKAVNTSTGHGYLIMIEFPLDPV